ncbi:methyltransferase domain-containing protein [uncultured Litoreibacter sp.]|uniref:class I SAM-dependent methyltransferase n=1 Tax=uncultured Litoreibacter sp. TaxID=1392394 RepID=UPI00262E03DA|nr:methyltransferase domain-containing protein [uncultured Litoreibacter sp.]
MSQPPILFDRPALLKRRARAVAQGAALFLHEEAAFEIKERLKDINRSFTKVAVVTGFAAFWSTEFPGATVISDDDILPLEVQSFDLVIHAMCLHQSNDPIGQLVQCQRALEPDGLLLVAMFGGQTMTELRAAISEAEVATMGGLSPRISPMVDIRDAGALLQRSGFALPVADADPRSVSYGSVTSLMHDLRAMGESNVLHARDKRIPPRALFDQMATLYPTQGERVVATFELLYLTGWAPDVSQQKPLRPGSASSRLADALNTVEMGEDARPVKTDESDQS